MAHDDVRMRGFSERTDLESALEILRSCVEPLETKSVPLREALGRTLAPEPYLSSVPADELRRGWLADAQARRDDEGTRRDQ